MEGFPKDKQHVTDMLAISGMIDCVLLISGEPPAFAKRVIKDGDTEALEKTY